MFRFVSVVAILALTAVIAMYVVNGEQTTRLGLPEGFPLQAEAAVD